MGQVCQPDDLQLRRRPPDERRDHAQLVGRLRRERRLGPGDGREAGLPLDPVRADVRPHADDLALRDEEGTPGALALTGHDDADGHPAQLLHPADLAGRVLERLDAVAQPRGVLEAELAREPLELRAQLRQRVVERLPLDALQRA